MGFRTILAAVDTSELGESTAKEALAFAEQVGATRVHLVHVVDSAPLLGWLLEPIAPETLKSIEAAAVDAVRERVERLLPAFGASGTSGSGIRVSREIRFGRPLAELLAVARAREADAVVVAAKSPRDLGRMGLGSLTANLLRTATCPLLVIGPERRIEGRVREVMAAIDLSPASGLVIETAIGALDGRPGRLVVMSALDSGPLPRLLPGAPLPTHDERAGHLRLKLESLLAKAVLPTCLTPRTEVRAGDPAQTILALAEEAAIDLIVLGSSGAGAIARAVLGSTANRVIAEASCPVLVVPIGPGAST
jgi:nucleotide-binding universal stress UspA family protein